MSGRESSSPSLLQSLKRFRFKKNVDKLGTDSGSDNVNSTTDSENLGSSENDNTSKTTKDGIDLAVNDSNGGKSDSDGQSSNHNDDSESELVINRKKNRLKVDDDSDDKNVDKESSDSSSELVIIRKKKRLKLDNSDASFNCDKSESEDSNKITKNKMSIKNYFSPKVVNDSSYNYKQNQLKTSLNSDTSKSNYSLKPNHHSNEDSDKIIISSDDSNNDDDGDVDCKMPSSSSNKGQNNKESKKKKKKSKKRRRNGSDNDSDDVAVEGHVYDSEADSDEEISNEMSGIKSEVFNFLNTAPEEELKEVKCSIKKIKALIEARPFAGWIHLVNTCLLNRGIGTEILNATQDLLTARAVLDKLMNRCERISKRTALAIADGKTNIVKQPEILTSCMQLKSYQMIGLNWLAVMHSQNISGILADEMGLGKTIQVIAFLAYLKERGHAIENSPHLIVVPSSTLENWCNEFKKWCPSLNVARYHGSQDERRTLRFHWVKYGFNGVEVILSTYQAVSGIYEDKKLFRVVSLHYAIFDEGHMLKNMNTQRYDSIFKINAKFKLLLTGTPVQNSLLELMSLLMFVMPEMFASWKEHIKFLFERKKGGVHDQVKYERDNVELVKKIMKPFILRRLKVDVLQDLPTKTSSIVECPLVESQAIKYAELVNQYKQSAAERDIGARTSYMSMFTDLRRLANHPLLLRYLYEDDQLTEMADLLSNDYDYKENDKEKIFEDLLYLSDHKLHKLTVTHKCLKKFSLPDSVFLESGKFVKLDEILPDLQTNNHRLLIFSQFIFILDILEEYLRIRDYTYLRIDGSTPVLERQQLIDLYNMDNQIFVFLLSTKAGGMGINLTSADTVIINDVDFNPYNDKQAEDRCHRVGQTKDVKIIRLVAKDTIEETIFKVAQEKANLGHEVTAADEVEEQKDMVSLLHSVLGIQNTT